MISSGKRSRRSACHAEEMAADGKGVLNGRVTGSRPVELALTEGGWCGRRSDGCFMGAPMRGRSWAGRRAPAGVQLERWLAQVSRDSLYAIYALVETPERDDSYSSNSGWINTIHARMAATNTVIVHAANQPTCSPTALLQLGQTRLCHWSGSPQCRHHRGLCVTG